MQTALEPDRFLANIIDTVIILLHFHFQVPNELPYICHLACFTSQPVTAADH